MFLHAYLQYLKMDEIKNPAWKSILDTIKSEPETNDYDATTESEDEADNPKLVIDLSEYCETVIKTEQETNDGIEIKEEPDNHDIIIDLYIKDETRNHEITNLDNNCEIAKSNSEDDNLLQNLVDIEMVINLKKCSKSSCECVIDQSDCKKCLKSNLISTINEKNIEFEIEVVKGEINLVKKHQQLQCDVCQKFYSVKLYLKYHPQHDLKIQSATPTIMCKICGKIFMYQKTLNKHSLIHKNEIYKNCDQCGKIFKGIGNLKRHLKAEHPGVKPYNCDKCKKNFKLESRLKMHQQAHHKESKPKKSRYDCKGCEKFFVSEGHLKRHLKFHGGGEVVKKINILKKNIEVRTYDRPYLCILCRKRFKTYQHLKLHRQIHTYERPFICETCGRAFKKKAHLHQHLSAHFGIKPYVCKNCGKGFTQMNGLLYHQSSKTACIRHITGFDVFNWETWMPENKNVGGDPEISDQNLFEGGFLG